MLWLIEEEEYKKRCGGKEERKHEDKMEIVKVVEKEDEEGRKLRRESKL